MKVALSVGRVKHGFNSVQQQMQWRLQSCISSILHTSAPCSTPKPVLMKFIVRGQCPKESYYLKFIKISSYLPYLVSLFRKDFFKISHCDSKRKLHSLCFSNNFFPFEVASHPWMNSHPRVKNADRLTW